jgi:hypothetical protein
MSVGEMFQPKLVALARLLGLASQNILVSKRLYRAMN